MIIISRLFTSVKVESYLYERGADQRISVSTQN